jgi:hypothetical protein
MNRKYWLRGLITGLIVSIIIMWAAEVTDRSLELQGKVLLMGAALSFIVVSISWLIGLAYGKYKKS